MLDDLFADGGRPDGLAPADRSLPLLLCVGRLHPVKQQDLLVRTWLATELWRTTTLVLVGGSTDRPTPAERRMRDTISALPAGQVAAARRLAMLPAMPNDEVRRLERALADSGDGVPTWYVCPSAKEEFGIAVLEAMEAGLPAAGPLRGEWSTTCATASTASCSTPRPPPAWPAACTGWRPCPRTGAPAWRAPPGRR
ncbi:glycosyltransferase [Streptomyces sp. Tue 6430]|nr:glycosyltransferase [Streptomyces sp. Tue 6430]